MRSIDELIVTEYLELNGFLAMPLRKGRLSTKRAGGDEGIDIYAKNTRFVAGGREPSFMLFSSELRRVESALICVRGWHGDKAALASMTSGSEMSKYVDTKIVKRLDAWLNFERWRDLGEKDEPKKILVAPVFPTQEPARKQIASSLQAKGVDGILSFKTMLLDIIDKVDTKHVYPKSDVLQLLRTLKAFDLVKDSQMNFLG